MFQSTHPENEADVAALKASLLSAPIGEMISYAALSEAVGRDVTERRWVLSRAIHEAEEESGGLFSTVRGEGIKRLETQHVADAGLSTINKIRRTAKRGHKRLSSVRVNDLPPQEQHRLTAHKSMLGAISLLADGRKSPTIAKEVAAVGHAIPAGRVLDLLKGKQE